MSAVFKYHKMYNNIDIIKILPIEYYINMQ